MKNWPQVALGELCDIYQPKTITSAQILLSGPYKVYGANGVIGYFDKYNHENTEIVVTCRGATCGTINITEPRSWITGNAMVVNPKDKRVLSKEFLFYILRATDFNRVITGAAQPQITRSSLAPFKISLPPLETQNLIVSLLDQATDLKKKREEADEKMAIFAPALFHQMFGDPAKNERGWSKEKLSDLCEILNGYAFKSEKYVDSGTRVIRITNVQKGFIVDNDPKFYPLNTTEPVQRYELREGDLLVSLTGNVGRVGLLQRDLLPAALNQRVACVRLRSSNILMRYLFVLLNGSMFENECINAASGVAQKNLSTTWLGNFQIPVPPIEKQQRFVELIEYLYDLQEKQRAQRMMLANAFDGMVQDLL